MFSARVGVPWHVAIVALHWTRPRGVVSAAAPWPRSPGHRPRVHLPWLFVQWPAVAIAAAAFVFVRPGASAMAYRPWFPGLFRPWLFCHGLFVSVRGAFGHGFPPWSPVFRPGPLSWLPELSALGGFRPRDNSAAVSLGYRLGRYHARAVWRTCGGRGVSVPSGWYAVAPVA